MGRCSGERTSGSASPRVSLQPQSPPPSPVMRGNSNCHRGNETSLPETCIPRGILNDFEGLSVTFPVLDKAERSSRHLPEAKAINPHHTESLSPARRGAKQRSGLFPPSSISAGDRQSGRGGGAPTGWGWDLTPRGGRRGRRGEGSSGRAGSALPGGGALALPRPSPPLPHVLFHPPPQ